MWILRGDDTATWIFRGDDAAAATWIFRGDDTATWIFRGDDAAAAVETGARLRYLRCVQTATPLAQLLRADLQLEPDLSEIHHKATNVAPFKERYQ